MISSCGKRSDAEISLAVISSVMNNLVVSIMNAKNNLTASDKFIEGYFSFYRLLKNFSSKNPSLVHTCNNKIEAC